MKLNCFNRITNFYVEGLKSMTLGKKLWKIIAIKLFIIFIVFKVFFFPDLFERHFHTDSERSDHVMKVLTRVPDSTPAPHIRTLADRRR